LTELEKQGSSGADARGGDFAALAARAEASIGRLARWLEGFGEVSQDVDDYFNNRYGRWAKGLYYKRPLLGTLAVAPLVAQEAFLPGRRGFRWRTRTLRWGSPV
jgi:hypothetical protein